MDTPQRHYSLLIWTRALSDSLFVLHILRDALEFQNRADALTDLAVRTHPFHKIGARGQKPSEGKKPRIPILFSLLAY